MNVSDIVKERLEVFKAANDEDRKKMFRDLEEQVRASCKKDSATTEDICNAIAFDNLCELMQKIEAQKLNEHFKNRYKIFDPITEWCEKHYYTDFIITIEADEEIITDIYEFNGYDKMSFTFLHDWDEGQSSIKLLGFIPVDSIHLSNIGRYVGRDDVLNIDSHGGTWKLGDDRM